MNAPASRTYAHCKVWVEQGHDVTVITGIPNFPRGKAFPGYRNRLYQKESMDGIEVIRVWTYMTNNKGLIRRSLDYLSYGFASFFAGLFIKTDTIVATSPQLFTAVSGRFLSLVTRKPWIMEVRDIWPESIVAVGALHNRTLIKILEVIEKGLYASASKIVVVTKSFRKTIISKGISPDKIHIIKNGVDQIFQLNGQIHEVPAALQEIKGKNNPFILGYIGTHGMAHGLDFILEAAHKCKSNVQFVLIGDGARKEDLMRKKESLNLSNVHFFDQIPKSDVPSFLGAVDAAIIPLRKSALFKTVIPSKIFEAAAMGIPILLGADGEAKELLVRYNAGLAFESENPDDFIDKVRELRTDSKVYERLKLGGLKLATDHNRQKLAMDMLALLVRG